MIKITEKHIDVQKVIDTASSLNAGAVNVFIGTVRTIAHGKNVKYGSNTKHTRLWRYLRYER
ncbi:MAG: molybdenum cofactor biosynthesis protein MoaE [Chryseolinea sp.]